ncbi:MAG: DUF488 family protein [Ktedonobacteraceae bacterium]
MENSKQEQEKQLVEHLAHAAAEILFQDNIGADVDPQKILLVACDVACDYVALAFEKHAGRTPAEADQRLVLPAAIAATHTYLRQQANGLGLLYTFGYTDVCADAVIAQLVALDVLIVDIRYSPNSRLAKWRQAQLQERLGEHYTHIQALGNVNYNRPGAPIQLYQSEVGVSLVGERLRRGQHLAMMCMCREVEECHRLEVARRVQKQLPGVLVIHL